MKSALVAVSLRLTAFAVSLKTTKIGNILRLILCNVFFASKAR